jgi:glycosyltransferase involved in cell wall biosynthesis
MHIFYIHQHFAVPSGSTGTRSYEFARRWVKAGHKVTLITGHYDIGGLKLSRSLVQRHIVEAINVVVVGIDYSNKHSFVRRIISFLFFMFLSTYVGLRTKGIDVIYATSTPLTVGIPAIILKRLKRVPFVFEVRDQWPEVPIELGIIRNRILIKILLWLERTIYKQSSAIVALSPGMANGVKAVLNGEKLIAVIPNSSDTDLFLPDINGSSVRQEKGWSDKLVFLYTGAMGKANGLDFVVDAAERLRPYDDIHFVLVGDGSEKERLARRIDEAALRNIEILDSVPKVRLPEIFAACDVSIVIFANYSILQHNSANKFFDSLSAGKPVLLNYSGWQRKILEDNKAGFGCDLCNLDEFVEKVLYFHSHRRQLKRMGRNARALAEREFARHKLADDLEKLLLQTVERVQEGCG